MRVPLAVMSPRGRNHDGRGDVARVARSIRRAVDDRVNERAAVFRVFRPQLEVSIVSPDRRATDVMPVHIDQRDRERGERRGERADPPLRDVRRL